MIRALGIGIFALGCVWSLVPTSAALADDGGAVVHPFFTPSRLFKGAGVRPVSDEVPPTVPNQPQRVLTEEDVESAPASGSCADGRCGDGRFDGRRHGGQDGRWQNYPPRPCWVNDQYEPEWYVAPFFGLGQTGHQSFDYGGAGVKFDPQGDGVGGAAFGWACGPTWLGRRRMEVELAIRSHDIDQVSVDNINVQVDGEMSAVSAMLNMFWDFKHPDRDWYPYLGFGVGAAQVGSISSPGDDDDNTDRVFAFQMMAGMSYRVRPYLELFGEARYFKTGEAELAANELGLGAIPPGIVPGVTPSTVPVEFDDFGIMVGCRILLGKRRCVDDVPAVDGRRTSGNEGWRFRRF